MADPRKIRLPCASVDHAARFSTLLAEQGVDVTAVSGRDLIIPFGGDARFAFAVAELAVDSGHANDDEASRAVEHALAMPAALPGGE